MNAALILQLLVELLAQGAQLAMTLKTAQAEGRDLTDAEVAAFLNSDTAARGALQAAIDQAKAQHATATPST